MQALLMHPEDSVMLAVVDLTAGETVQAGGVTVLVREPVPSGHKLACRPVPAGSHIFKYGQPIGRATADIAAGAHVHVHNVESLRGAVTSRAGPRPPTFHWRVGARRDTVRRRLRQRESRTSSATGARMGAWVCATTSWCFPRSNAPMVW